LIAPEGRGPQPITARDLVSLLDSAGISRAAVLSVAYLYGSPARTVDDEYTKVRVENNWTAAQAALYPDRLSAFCSFNPLKEYAIAELERCARDPILRRGIKLHLGNSDVLLEEPTHLARLERVFQLANRHRMAIVIHLRASISNRRPYGAAQAQAFLDRLLAAAPNVPVQVAHMAGSGPGYDDQHADDALAVLAAAVEQKDRRTRQLWFDVTTVANGELSPERAALLVRRIRQVGVDRVLYGSDAATGTNLRPREGWAAFRRLPLTEEEFARIASNVAPYLR
jgi:predicted TIM-barrel fold metal-dependent hydrolase